MTKETLRPQGKRIESLLAFLEEGMKGKAVVYVTSEGNFLSPKAVENALSQQRQELKEEVEKMKAFTDYPDTDEGRQARHENRLYNEALNKVLALLSKEDTNV